jgi:hypothetical protein
VVVHPERRAAIARDEASSLEAGKAVAFALQHRKPDQRLDAGQIDTLGLDAIFVVESDLQQRHPCVLPKHSRSWRHRRGPPVKSMHRQCQYRPEQARQVKHGLRRRRLAFERSAGACMQRALRK